MVDKEPTSDAKKVSHVTEIDTEGWVYAGAGQAKPSRENKPKWPLALVGVAAIIAMIALFIAFGLGDDDKGNDVVAPKVVAELAAASPNQAECPDGRRFFAAYDAPVGSNAMGPKLEVSNDQAGLRKAFDRLWFKAQCDPLWFAHANEGLTVDKPENFDSNATTQDAVRFNNDSASWQQAVNVIAQEITGYELRDYGTTRYDSLGMIVDPSGDRSKMPTLTKWSEQPELHMVLVVKTKNHGERLFRLDCDLQFSAPELPKVPPAPPTQKPDCNSTGGCVTTTLPPTTSTNPPTTTTNPPTSTTTTTPPTTTTSPPPEGCPPGTYPHGDECWEKKDPSDGPTTSIGSPMPPHTDAPETTQPPRPSVPMDPEQPTDAPQTTGVQAPSATPVPETSRQSTPTTPSELPQTSTPPTDTIIEDPGES